jgi:histidinol-phosphate aminotransferase
MNRYWSDTVRQLSPYVPGEQPKIDNLVKLNTNENPYPPAPGVLAAIRREAGDGLRRYPDPNAEVLKAAIADNFGLTSQQVFVGNGSDEVLAHAFFGLLKQQAPIRFPDITYSFYPVYCRLYDIAYETVPLDAHYAIDLAGFNGRCGGVILPNPNAPTGRALPRAAIETMLRAQPDVVVIVDEAYVDFGTESAVGLIARYPNLLVTQTLSKSRSLAGLRVGYALGDAGLIEGLERVKNSFNSYPLDRLAIAGAVAAFEDRDYFERTRLQIIASRDRLAAALGTLDFEVLPSGANFVFARHATRDAATLQQGLRERRIIVRHFAQPRIDQFLRITVGTDAECDILLAALRDLTAG